MRSVNTNLQQPFTSRNKCTIQSWNSNWEMAYSMAVGVKSVTTVGNDDFPQTILAAIIGSSQSSRRFDYNVTKLHRHGCTVIGFIENLDNEDFNEISQIDKEDVKNSTLKDKPLPKPLSKEEKEAFIEKAKKQSA